MEATKTLELAFVEIFDKVTVIAMSFHRSVGSVPEIKVAPNFGFGKFENWPFFQIRPNSASAKFLAEFGRRQYNCSAF